MADQKGKILKVDVENKKVLLRTGVSDSKEWGKGVEVLAHVEIDYSTASLEQILTWATGDRRIAVRAAHLIPLGPETCKQFTMDNPYRVKAEHCTKRQPKEESAEEIEAKIKALQELLKIKKGQGQKA